MDYKEFSFAESHKIEYTGGFMRKIRNLIIIIIIMSCISILSLGILSVLSYIYKWQADKALVGITFTYILAGFVGGLGQKIINREEKTMGRKMLGGILLSTLFMAILVIASIFLIQNPFMLSSRFLMIWMVLMGSTCLGRIL